MAENLSLSATQLESILRTLVAEIRKPPVDPIKEAQKTRQEKMKNEGNKERWARMLDKLTRCLHSREDGTCVIAWAVQSDGVERGYCPHCDCAIVPELAQLFPERKEEMTKLYQEQRKRPRGRKENIRYVA